MFTCCELSYISSTMACREVETCLFQAEPRLPEEKIDLRGSKRDLETVFGTFKDLQNSGHKIVLHCTNMT